MQVENVFYNIMLIGFYFYFILMYLFEMNIYVTLIKQMIENTVLSLFHCHGLSTTIVHDFAVSRRRLILHLGI